MDARKLKKRKNYTTKILKNKRALLLNLAVALIQKI